MSRVLEFFKQPWVMQLLGLMAIAVLIWFVGPLIAIAGYIPLESAAARGIVLVVMFGLWLAYRLFLFSRSIRRERELLAGLRQTDSQFASDEAIRAEKADEVDGLRKGFDEALDILKQTRTGKGARRSALYDMPWYAIIGAPGSGKTTALINSGLRFPLAEKLGRHAIKGVSGTRNCDWWFSDEAVLLDTAGRFTTQDSHQTIDAAGWNGFLQLLKTYRPRRPLNGILVAASASDLLQQTEEERRQHALTVRQRVHELYGALGVKLPVYVLCTKVDLVAGFADYFADFGNEDRAQVWGETFPVMLADEGAAGEPLDLARQFQSGFDELLQRVNNRVFKRLQEERDVQRRGSILDFPQQLAMLKPLIAEFLQLTFGVNRYEAPAFVRGVYLTSGTQEGTPIDRVMGMLAQAFRLDRQSVPMYSGKGRSYFIGRLIRQVIFSEAELVGINPKMEARQRWLQLGAYGLTLGACVLVIALWILSYNRNQAAIAQVETQIANYRAVDIRPTDTLSNFTALLPRLNALKAARDVYAEPSWTLGMGLYQGDKLGSAIDNAYEDWLLGAFAPAITFRLKERMQGVEGQNPEVLYQLLRVYLMFGDPEHMDSDVVTPWVRLDWEHLYSTDSDSQAALSGHLGHLLTLTPIKIALDETFVSSVRHKLTNMPVVEQIYSRLRSEMVIDHSHDLRLGSALPPTTPRVFTTAKGDDITAVTLPGFFTSYGFTQQFLKRSLPVVKESLEQNWVLGSAQKLDPGDLVRLHDDIKKLYLGEYQRTWRGLLDSIKIKSSGGARSTTEYLDVLGRSDGPLRGILDLVAKNTGLTRLTAEAAGLVSQTWSQQTGVSEASAGKALNVARQVTGAESGADPVRALELHFEPLNALVRGGEPGRPVPLDATLAQILSLRDYLMQVGGGANGGGQALRNESARYAGSGPDVVRQAQTEFSHLPEPVRTWLLTLTQSGGTQIASEAKAKLSDKANTDVGRPCQEMIRDRYPFVRSARQDVLLGDFSKLFAANGIIDRFFQADLRDFVDTTKPEWRELGSDKPLGLSAVSLRQFQRAARIRDAFFGASSSSPQIQFELKPLALDNTVGTFRINIEGQEATYRHGPEQVARLQWPGPSAGSGVRIVFETLDGRQVTRSKDGPWALFRLLDEITVDKTGVPDRFNLTFQADGYTARYELRAGSVNNPFSANELQAFRCPEGL